MDNLSLQMEEFKQDLQSTKDKVQGFEAELRERASKPTYADALWEDQNWPKVGEAVSKGKSKGSGGGGGKAYNSYSGQKASGTSDPSGLAFSGQDKLIIGGFPKGASREVREAGVMLVLNKLRSTKKYFEEPIPLYREERVCAMRKRCDASWSVMSAAISEYKEAGAASFTVSGVRYTLWVGWQKTPERRRRNAILRRLEARAVEKGAKNVEIDWWGGNILVGDRRIASA